MRRIFALGETVYDIIFQNGIPIAAKVGGSMLNAAISIARLNIPAWLITEYGEDHIGHLVDEFLEKENVDTEYVYRYPDGKTAISTAMLNNSGDAQYSFYKILPQKRLDIKLPEINKNDILMFGSFFAINSDTRYKITEILYHARKQGALICYDPNFRKVHLEHLADLKEYIIENISLSDLVRGSDEDFRNIFNSQSSEEAYEKVAAAGCSTMIYTANKYDVIFHTKNMQQGFYVPPINPVSTIGAGDSFNAGIVSSVYDQEINRKEIESLSKERWTNIINRGIEFGRHVCTIYDNYITEEFAQAYRARS